MHSTVDESKSSHGKISYYQADSKISSEAQNLLQQQELIVSGDAPKFLAKTEVIKIGKTLEINKYDFMNDGILVKAIIDLAKNYPDLISIKQDEIKMEFTKNSFKLTAKREEKLDTYIFWMKKTRENFIPEKSKFYIRKDKIYIALHKEKEEDWFTLKGVD